MALLFVTAAVLKPEAQNGFEWFHDRRNQVIEANAPTHDPRAAKTTYTQLCV